ncbi:MAG: SRPBCC family protein [Pseudomonadota bacterium]
MTAEHDSFTLTRKLGADPDRAWRAWTDPDAKRRWFAEGNGPDWQVLDYDLDPREGGAERAGFRHRGGPPIRYAARLIELKAPHRLIYSYEMTSDGARISASLATVTFAPDGPGTALRYTEQIVFLDGGDSLAPRLAGTEALLDRLAGQIAASVG